MKDLSIFKKVASIGTAMALVTTLGACSSKSTAVDESSSSSNVTYNDSSSSVSTYIDSDSSAVETAIELMMTEGEIIAESTEETKNSEAYQEAKEEVLDNFITLSGFLSGDVAIGGHYIDDVEDGVVDYALEARDALDEDLERIYPDYKEKLKEKGIEFLDFVEEKGTDLAAKGYDKFQELKAKTLSKTSSNK